MKKLFAMLLATVMLVCMSACSEEKEDVPTSDRTTTGDKAPAETTSAATTSQLTAEDLKDWGAADEYSAWNDNGIEPFYFRFPMNTGSIHGQGLVAAQEDRTIVVVGADSILQPVEVSGLDGVFPAYFEAVTSSLSDYLGVQASDFEFEIESKETTTVNDYEMCRYAGNHTYTYEGSPFSSRWVAYSTKLESNDAYVYWMVLDYSEDQSLEATIADHAYKMALTIEE